ncbi:MAG: ATP-binding protein [bacterium]
MILRRLRVRRFKGLDNQTFTFTPGLNVVYGPNESGKTTLMEALFTGLLMNPAQPPADFAELARPWGEQRLGELILEFEANGATYLLRKDLEAGTALLQRQDRSGSVDGAREIQQRILDWLGLPGESAFRSTAFVGQGELARVTDERRLIGARLARVLSGGGTEDVDGALRWLDDRRRALEGAAAKSGEREGIAALTARLADVDRRGDRTQGVWGELRGVTRQLDDLERQMAAKTEQLTAADAHGQLQRRVEAADRELRETWDQLTRYEKLAATQVDLDARLRTFTDQSQAALGAFIQARRTAQGLQQALATGRQQLEREEGALEQLGSRHQRSRRRAGIGLVLGAAGGAAAISGVFLLQVRGLFLGWGVVAAAIVLVLLAINQRGRVGTTGVQYRRQEQRVLELRRRVEGAQAQLRDADRELQGQLSSLGADSLEAVERRFSTYMEVVRQQEETRMAMQQLLAGRTRDRVAERVSGLEAELAEARAGLAEAPDAAKAVAASRERLARETATLQKEAEALRERKGRLSAMLEGQRDRPEQREVIEEQIAALQRQQTRTAEFLEVLAFTRRMLEEARRQSFFPARELLERGAGDYLRVATRGAYAKISLDERTLTPRLWVDAVRGWKGPAGLSQGTVDQLYLSLRLALLDVICQGRTPPLFLDEPFVNVDPERMSGVLDLLTAAARARQVFLFTAWRHDELPADQVITLPVRQISA